jgi:hypothetical protein
VNAPAGTGGAVPQTVAGALAARYPHLAPAECLAMEDELLRFMAAAIGSGMTAAAVRRLPDGDLDVTLLTINDPMNKPRPPHAPLGDPQ